MVVYNTAHNTTLVYNSTHHSVEYLHAVYSHKHVSKLETAETGTNRIESDECDYEPRLGHALHTRVAFPGCYRKKRVHQMLVAFLPW